jgi:hypothetical protein
MNSGTMDDEMRRTDKVRCRTVPAPPLVGEIEISCRHGKVNAGPFIGEYAQWTPDQAEQFADYLKSAAELARQQSR